MENWRGPGIFSHDVNVEIEMMVERVLIVCRHAGPIKLTIYTTKTLGYLNHIFRLSQLV